MSDHSQNHDDPVPSARPLRLESASGEFVLIPQSVEPQADKETEESINLGKVLAILRRQMPLALGVMATTVGLGAALTLYQRIFTPIFEGEFSLLVGDPVNSVVESQSSDSSNSLKDLALQSARVPTIQVSQDLIDVLKSPLLIKPISKQMGIEEAKIESNLSIERRWGDASSVLDVTLKWRDPSEGQRILTMLKDSFLSFSTTQRREKLAQGINYLNEQAPALQNKLAVVQGQLSDFRIRNGLLDPSTEGAAMIKRLEDLEGRQDDLLRKEAELKALAQAVRAGNLTSQQIPGGGQLLSTTTRAIGAVDARPGTGLDQLQLDLAQLQKELAVAEATFQSASPVVQSLKARIGRVQALLQRRQLNAINVTLKQINGEQGEIKRQQANLRKKFIVNPKLIKENDAIQQRLEVAKANLAAYIKAREDIRLLVAQRTIPWKVISPPSFKSKLSTPNAAKNLLLSLMLGFGAGVGAALLRDKLEDVFHSHQEVAEKFGLPLLGSIPFLPSLFNFNAEDNSGINPKEETRILRRSIENLYTNIRMLSSEDDIRLIAITSTVQVEGKSSLTYLYAKELNSLGKRILVVDANLSQPSLHHFFGVANGLGFFNLLSDGSNRLSDFVQSLSTNLHILTAGSTSMNPMNLLCTKQFSHLIEQIRISTDYDYVLFDLPPALELSDPLLISEKLDIVLFVVSLEHVRRELPELALMRIRSTGTSVLGIITTSLHSTPGSTLSILERVKSLKSGFSQRQDRKMWRGVAPKST